MSCAKYEPLMALYIEGDLADDEARVVALHLETCDVCREFAAGIRDSQGALKTLRTEFVNESVYQEVRREVLSRMTSRPKPAMWPRYAVAAGLAIALLAGWLGRMQHVASLWLQPRAAVIPSAPLVTSQPPAPHTRMVRVRRRRPRLAPSFKSEPLVVKMITDDPQVVIYWLVDQNGG